MSGSGKLHSAIIAASLGAFFALVVPLQTYLGNQADYSFGLLRLVLEQLAVTVLLAAVAYVLLRLSERWVGGWLSPLLTGVLVCLYLEAGPLSFGLPEINGALSPVLGSVSRKIVDSLILGGVVLAFAVAFRLLRPWLHWVALGVLAIGLASLLDVRTQADAVNATAAADCGGMTVASKIIESVEYSPARNVMMFVLDSMPATVACDIVTCDPGLASHFPGFIGYRRNIGMHDCTKRGVPGFMTGRYFDPKGRVSKSEYMMSVLSTNSLLQAYRDHGDAIYCCLDVLSYGYTTAPDLQYDQDPSDASFPVVLDPATEVPYMSLAAVSFYRLVPFAAKEAVLSQYFRSRKALASAAKRFANEHLLYPWLASRPISADGRQMFCKFHTLGSHMPIMFDCDGHPVKGGHEDVAALYQATSNALVHLSRLMDAYRAKGIYDKSLIVVMADHGSPLAPHAAGAHPNASANLWIKPDGASGPIKISDVPTSHAKIAELMRRSCLGPMTRREIDETLRVDNRLFRYVSRKDNSIVSDWIFHEDGTFDRPKGEYATE